MTISGDPVRRMPRGGFIKAAKIRQGYAEAERQLKQAWRAQRERIEARLEDFKRIGERASEEEIFIELVFCLFTPQSKARSCWSAVQILLDKDLLLKGDRRAIAAELSTVRFRNNKAGYVVRARELFSRAGGVAVRPFLAAPSREAREWLVTHVKGMGYKEASHFLRNIGRGGDIAILDRHILKNLRLLGVIRRIPASLGKKAYLAIERKMAAFAHRVRIPLDHLDLLLWCRETGEIFK